MLGVRSHLSGTRAAVVSAATSRSRRRTILLGHAVQARRTAATPSYHCYYHSTFSSPSRRINLRSWLSSKIRTAEERNGKLTPEDLVGGAGAGRRGEGTSVNQKTDGHLDDLLETARTMENEDLTRPDTRGKAAGRARTRAEETPRHYGQRIGPRVLITGASSGIGQATASALMSQLGAEVVVASRSKSQLLGRSNMYREADKAIWRERKEASSKMQEKEEKEEKEKEKERWSTRPFVSRARLAGRIIGIEEMDVTKPEDWDKMVQKWPDIDILVNAAGHLDRGLLVKQDVGEIDKTIQTNLLGPIYGSRAYAKAMMKHNRKKKKEKEKQQHQQILATFEWLGRERERERERYDRFDHDSVIINISSLLAARGGHGAVAYAASKAGLVGLTRSLTTEVTRSGIRVNAILPGWIDSGMGDVQQLQETLGETWTETQRLKIPLERFGSPNDVAYAVLFLIRSRYAAGCVLNLDGGLSAVD